MAEPKQSPTEYQVLKLHASADTSAWTEWKVQSGVSATAAIRSATRKGDVHIEGVYKAVPMRSWKQGVRIETKQIVQSSFKELDADALPESSEPSPGPLPPLGVVPEPAGA